MRRRSRCAHFVSAVDIYPAFVAVECARELLRVESGEFVRRSNIFVTPFADTDAAGDVVVDFAVEDVEDLSGALAPNIF